MFRPRGFTSLPRALLPLLPAALVAAATATGVSSCAGGNVGDGDRPRPNVLLIVVDTLRREELGAYGYPRSTSPNLDRLARAAVRYDQAFSQAAWTTPSISSLLTSRYPSQLGIEGELTKLAEDVVLLPEVLRAEGYVTGGVVSHSFCSQKWNFDQGFDFWDQSSIGGHKAITSPGVTERALEFLDQDREQPFFLWLHYFDPHVAYVEHAAFRFGTREEYDGPRGIGRRGQGASSSQAAGAARRRGRGAGKEPL